jgi:hypothetical protein
LRKSALSRSLPLKEVCLGFAQKAKFRLTAISTGPVPHQLAHLPDHSIHKGDYEIERDYENGENEEYRFIASRTPEMFIE